MASPSCDITHAIHFEKRFVEGGSASFFGSGMEVGYNGCSDEYDWWYYCDKVKELVKVFLAEVLLLCAALSILMSCAVSVTSSAMRFMNIERSSSLHSSM